MGSARNAGREMRSCRSESRWWMGKVSRSTGRYAVIPGSRFTTVMASVVAGLARQGRLLGASTRPG
ncbi:uncharacterized protein B0I36DRAFT_330972 [Microdochium trichocladiopsis]|uniref:Uncharacterized protein n=1 Tax=Microdochium trichocladiopsis TaxID=1682393 RepID=A0A9P9BMT3_9PEZI|nr:uncharacterized protein B0I36DRAFT_330972 [Microdochium trichocladiopsis]KAH7026593.1 hypothetical protein B0I36DRAFT_330972 [Microdochium trichocladiopsis]